MAAIYNMATVINMAMITTNLRAVNLRPLDACLVPRGYGWLPLEAECCEAHGRKIRERQEGKELNSIFTVARMGKLLQLERSNHNCEPVPILGLAPVTRIDLDWRPLDSSARPKAPHRFPHPDRPRKTSCALFLRSGRRQAASALRPPAPCCRQ